MASTRRGRPVRRRPRPATRIGFLEQLPAVTLLDRMPMPVIAVGLEDGVLVYTNPTSADLLGYADSTALTAQSLPTLMAEHALTPPRAQLWTRDKRLMAVCAEVGVRCVDES